MNSRKRIFPRTLNQIKEEMTSSNMSIDEDSNQNSEIFSPEKNVLNSLISSKMRKSLKLPRNSLIPQSQKRPQMNFSLYAPKTINKKNKKKNEIINSAFTSKKRKKSKNNNKEKNNKDKRNSNISKFEIDDDELDPNDDIITSNKLLEEIIQSFTTFNYSEYELNHYFDDNHLNLTQETDPYIELKVLCTSENVDLRCVNTSYIIGENGLNCSMKNYNRDVTTIGRQQINQEMIRPNDIMLFPTDSSLSRCHLTVYHKIFFDEIKKYKHDVDITLRISKRSKYNSLPQKIWLGIIHFLKPRLKLEIQDQGTIYGSYVKIDELSVVNLLINCYILLSDSRGDLFNFFRSDFMYNQIVNNFSLEQSIYNSTFINGNEEQINSMPILQVIQKIFYELRRSSPKTVGNNIKEYLNKNFNNFLMNPYGDEFAYDSLFSQANQVLKKNQFFLTSNQSGLVISKIGNLGQILEDVLIKYNDLQYLYQHSQSLNPINISVLSIGKINEKQKKEPNSRIYCALYNSISELGDININNFGKFLNEKAIEIIETEGDCCGLMSHKRIIILVDTLFSDPENSNAFSILFQRGFVFGKNKYTCLHCPNFDCNVFISYSIQAKCWAINEISNLFRHNENNNNNNNNYIGEQNFGLYICTSDEKVGGERFKQKKYCVKQGDKIKISDTILQVKFHI
jgi:hypothetical protein